MRNLFFMAKNYITATNAPIISSVEDVFPTNRYELDSYDHWLFYDDNPLVGKVNSRNLTVQSGAALQPVFSDKGVSLTNAKGSALMTDLIDNATTDITCIYALAVNGEGLYLTGMTLPTTNVSTESGFGGYVSANKAYLNLKPLVSNSTGAIQGLTNNQTIDQQKTFIIAVSVNKTTKKATLYTMNSTSDSFVSTTFTGTYENASKAISVGNAYYNGVESGARSLFAEAVIYSRALNVSEIKLAANRMMNRLKNNNVII